MSGTFVLFAGADTGKLGSTNGRFLMRVIRTNFGLFVAAERWTAISVMLLNIALRVLVGHCDQLRAKRVSILPKHSAFFAAQQK